MRSSVHCVVYEVEGTGEPKNLVRYFYSEKQAMFFLRTQVAKQKEKFAAILNPLKNITPVEGIRSKTGYPWSEFECDNYWELFNTDLGISYCYSYYTTAFDPHGITYERLEAMVCDMMDWIYHNSDSIAQANRTVFGPNGAVPLSALELTLYGLPDEPKEESQSNDEQK